MTTHPLPTGIDLARDVAFARRLAFALLHDDAAADDVAQDAAVAALRGGADGARSRPAWLVGVVRNLVRMRRRGDARRARREAAAAPRAAALDPAALAEQLDAHRAVVDALEALEAPYRTALWLRYVHDLSPHAIAATLHEPVATVKTRLRRGLERLRDHLDAGPRRSRWRASLGLLVAPQGGGVPRRGLVAAAGLTLAVGAVVAGSLAVARPRASAPVAAGAPEVAAAAPDLRVRRADVGRPTEAVRDVGPPSATPASAAAPPHDGAEAAAPAPASNLVVPPTGASAADRLASVRYRTTWVERGPLDALGEAAAAADVELELPTLEWDGFCGPGWDPTLRRGSTTSAEAVLRSVFAMPWGEAVAHGRLRVLEPGAPGPGPDDGWARVPRRPLAVDAPYPTFSVVVLDPDGRAVEGARLLDGGTFPVGVSDAEGRVAVEARPWAHRLSYVVRAAGYRDETAVRVPRGVAAGARVEVTLRTRAARLRGVVTGPDGRPLAGASVTVLDLADATALDGYPQRWTRTGPDGTWDEPGAPAGEVAVAVYAPGCAWAQVRRSARVGETTTADVTLEREATLSGVVRDATGAPLDDVTVLATADGLPSPFSWASTDASGRYRLLALPSAVVRVSVQGSTRAATPVAVGPGEERTLDLVR
ncbi:MAG: sigma-70 family RNA polymerase sigma factor [Planctomycetes bacterium]|nr:sigma-70 family RNA polymerase sigma factor [Planctomycetota bacterium]